MQRNTTQQAGRQTITREVKQLLPQLHILILADCDTLNGALHHLPTHITHTQSEQKKWRGRGVQLDVRH